MNVHVSYKLHKTSDIEKEINHLIGRLSKRLQVFRPELVHLKGVVAQNSPREGASASLNLRLPSGQMTSEESAQTATAAIKAAGDELLHQLNKHKELLRHSHNWRGRRHGRNRAQAQVPFETTMAAIHLAAISADDIRSYVNANLGRLERFIERELFFRETSQPDAYNLVSKEEVLDETIVHALGDTAERPERLALEPWLYKLALRAMDDLASPDPENGSAIHLEQSVRPQNVRASDEAELQSHQPDETFTEETVIADHRVASPEDATYSGELMTLVQYALGGTHRDDREAFLLHVIEGFTVQEVADITDTDPGDVLASIGKVQDHLRRSPPLAARYRSRLLQTAGSA
jgi:DNA-directed RNA polymerase specialized sigma24 family protein